MTARERAEQVVNYLSIGTIGVEYLTVNQAVAEVERAILEAVTEERETCAQVAEEFGERSPHHRTNSQLIANAIRNRPHREREAQRG